MNERAASFGRALRRPFIARGVWLSIVLLDIALTIIGLMVSLPLELQPCTELARVCFERGQWTVAELAVVNATGWSVQAFVWTDILNQAAVKVVGLVIGFLIFWRKPNDRMAWVASLYLVIGLGTSVFPTLAAAQPALWLITGLLDFVGSVCFALFFYVFPTGRFVPHWTRWLGATWALIFFFITFFPQSPLNINLLPPVPFALVGGSLFVSLLLAQGYRYFRVSKTTEREQTKWVVSALIVGLVLILFSLYTVITRPDPDVRITPYWYLTTLGFSALSYLLPIAIGIAILRYRLFDIDLLIRKTLTYALVVALLLVVYFGSVILLQQAFASVTGQRSEVITVLSTLAIAALFVPLRNRVQGFIDRRFYRKKYDAQQVLEDFAKTVRDETDLEKLTARLMQVVDETMQPKNVSVWLKAEGRAGTNPGGREKRA